MMRCNLIYTVVSGVHEVAVKLGKYSRHAEQVLLVMLSGVEASPQKIIAADPAISFSLLSLLIY